MRNRYVNRGLAAVLALLLLLALVPAAAAADSDPFIQLVATDVTLDETVFSYTGQEIRPNVTVRVNGQLLTLDKDYYLDYANNIEIGEAKVIVTGIATAGYVGTVEHPFFITEKEEEQEPEFTLITLTEEMVAIEGTEFPYTGEAIEPAVTVTIDGQTLENGKDYAVEYINNLIPGTGTVIVRGIATASETLGYTGEVRKDFLITKTPEETPETSKPTEAPETSEPTVPAAPEYKITKGDKAMWYLNSSSALSFTADGPFADFKGVSVDGKQLAKTDFEAKAGTVVLLNNAYLKTLKAGDHTITIHFAEADAEGTFRIAEAGENPKTGDAIGIWLMLLLSSGTAVTLLRRKYA